MAEIFGAVAGGITVCAEMIKICKKIHKSIKKVQHTRSDVADLADEAVIFAGLYQVFLRDCSPELKACASTASSIYRLESWTRTTISELQQLLHSVEVLRPDHGFQYRLSESVSAHWQWFFSTSFVKSLRASLGVARESINAFASLTCIKKLDSQLQILRRALHDPAQRQIVEDQYKMPLEDKIIEVEKEKMNMRQVYHANKRMREVAKEALMVSQPKSGIKVMFQEISALQELDESCESYARDILHPGRSTRRTRFHNSARSPHQTSQVVSSGSTSIPSTKSIWTSDQSLLKDSDSGKIPRAQGLGVRPSPAVPGVQQREHPGEYINDPNGNILSPPKVKSRSPSAITTSNTESQVLWRREVGSHTIELHAKNVCIDDHPLLISDNSMPEAFCQALVHNSDRLDELSRALNQKSTEVQRWSGIEGWEIYIPAASITGETSQFQRKTQISGTSS